MNSFPIEFICDKYLISVWFDSNGYDIIFPHTISIYSIKFFTSISKMTPSHNKTW